MGNSLKDQLEGIVLSAIKRGRNFATGWVEIEFEIHTNSQLKQVLPQEIQRLTDGDPLAINDERALTLMGEAIRDELNRLKDGYGDLAMRFDTSEHLIFDREREALRMLLEHWKTLQAVR